MGSLWTSHILEVVLVCATVAGCSPQSPGPAEPTPDLQLLLVPGASNIGKMANVVNSAVYDVAEDYPATKTISSFDEQFARASWTPTADDALNPNMGARMREWVAVQGRNDPHEIRTWDGQWSHPTFGLAMVTLKYEAGKGVRVQALFVPSKAVTFAQSADRERLSRQRQR